MMATYLDAKNAKAAGKPRTLSFGAGLFLFVTPAGTKSWRCYYARDGRKQVAVLGHFPAMSIAEAKTARLAIRNAVRDGGDPRAERHAAKRDRRDTNAATVETVGRTWLRFAGRAWTENYRRATERRLDAYIIPAIGEVPIAMVRRDAILELVHGVERRYRAQAIYVRQHLSSIFDFALADHLVEYNPVSRNAKYLPTRRGAETPEQPRAHVRTIEDARRVLAAVEKPTGNGRLPDPASLLVHRLIALTGVRKMEAVEAAWSEIDLDAGTWTIPAARMKGKRGAKRDHAVTLAPQALDVLYTARRIASVESTLVFPAGLSARSRPLNASSLNATLIRALARAGMAGRHSIHGWRSTFSTILNEADPTAYRVIDAMLAHRLIGASHVEGRYMHAEFAAERRRIACAWADMLMLGAPSASVLIGLATDEPANVVNLADRRAA